MGLGLGLVLVQWPAAGQPAPAAANVATNMPKLSPKEQGEQWGYALGMSVGTYVKRSGLDVDTEAVITAFKDVLAGRPTKLTEQQAMEAQRSFQMAASVKMQEMQKVEGEKNRKAGNEFLAENKKKPGVQTLAVSMPGGTNVEMQYKVLAEGSGPTPSSNDVVEVNYRGTLISGKEFDSSAAHGNKPAKFPVRGVIRGWTEALEKMKVGSKWQIFVPSSLAYGDRPRGPGIEPGSTLIFEMELVGIEPPQAAPKAAAPAVPLTSDVIKVPSAEGLKKGEKIEVIKAEDLEKMTNAAATAGSNAVPPKPANK